MEIAVKLLKELSLYPQVILAASLGLAVYPDGVPFLTGEATVPISIPTRLLVATGASEKFLQFDNNDLPEFRGGCRTDPDESVRILPGKSVLMIGSGNIGLIVSYQLDRPESKSKRYWRLPAA